MLMLFALICLYKYIICIYGDFLYSETNGIFHKETKFNFSIFIGDSTGIILYARDSENNTVIIKLQEPKKGEKEIYLNFNNKYLKENITNICNCTKCVDEFILFEINTKQITVNAEGFVLYVKCNQKLTKLENKHQQEQLKSYPIPKDVGIKTNKTFIWIGNVGPYIGYQNKLYRPIKDQLSGCLDYFYFNNVLLSFERNGSEMWPICKSQYEEKIFDISQYDHAENMSKYKVNKIIVNNDCLFWIINETICKTNIPIYNKHNQSYILNNSSNIFTVIKLTWKPFLQKNYCLIELKLKDGSFLVVYLDQSNDYIWYNYNKLSLKLMKILSGNINNNLLMKISNNNFTLSINSGNQIHTFIGYLLTNVIITNIGLSIRNNICTTFEGAMNAKLESENQLELLVSTKISTSANNNNNNDYMIYIIPLIFVIGIIVLVSIVLIKFKNEIIKIKGKFKIKDDLVNGDTMSLYHVIVDCDAYGVICDGKFDRNS